MWTQKEVLAIYKYLDVLLDKLIPKIYGFMGLTYELVEMNIRIVFPLVTLTDVYS